MLGLGWWLVAGLGWRWLGCVGAWIGLVAGLVVVGLPRLFWALLGWRRV